MTPDDVLGLLPIVAERGWRILSRADEQRDRYLCGGAIRDRDNRCPICALAHEISGGAIDFKDLARHSLSMLAFAEPSIRAIEPIIAAADLPKHALRPALMRALGMAEP